MFHTQTNSVRQMQNKILLLKCLPLKLQDRTTLPLKSMNADHILNRGNCQSSTDVYETSCLESNQILCLCSVHRTPRESHQGYHHTRNTTVVQSRAKVRVPIFWASGSCVQDISIKTKFSSSNYLVDCVLGIHVHRDGQRSIRGYTVVLKHLAPLPHSRPQLQPLLHPRWPFHVQQ